MKLDWHNARRFAEKAYQFVNYNHKRQVADYKKIRKLFYRDFWKQAADSLDCSIEDIGYGFYRISDGQAKTYVNNHEVMLDNRVILRIAGNKALTNKLLREYGYPTPQYLEYDLASMQLALDFLGKLNGNAVVKPADGTGAGRGITTTVSNGKRLKKASLLASTHCKNILIESEIKGASYRLLYLDYDYIDAIRRDSPAVIGDGISTVKELIKQENRRRLSGSEIIALNPLNMDYECKLTLKARSINLRYVPKKNERLVVKGAVNQNCSKDNHIVKNEVHSSVIKLGSEIMKNFSIRLGGIDIITPDIGMSLRDSGGIINEINTTPGLHHHVLIAEKDQIQPIGKRILENIFSQ